MNSETGNSERSFWHSIFLGLYWRNRPLTFSEYAISSIKYLDVLNKCLGHPVNMSVLIAEGRNKASLPSSDDQIEKVLREALPAYNYINDNVADQSLRASSLCNSPFIGNFEVEYGSKADLCMLRLSVGRADAGVNLVSMQLYDSQASSMLLRSLFSESVAFWRPAQGFVNREIISRAIGPAKPGAQVGWLTYLAAPSAVPSLDGVERTELADGILLQTSKQIPSDECGDEVEKIKALKLALEQSQ